MGLFRNILGTFQAFFDSFRTGLGNLVQKREHLNLSYPGDNLGIGGIYGQSGHIAHK